ncbi:MAG: selenium cofactor biosynthesis protein YqeC, partial [Treponemataceae bacterium]
MKNDSLIHNLKLPIDKKIILSVVGAGGKTSLIYNLSKEFAALEKKNFICTTTHMMIPCKKGFFLEEGKIKNTTSFFYKNAIIIAGKKTKLHKFTQLTEANYKKIANQADIILIEADGAKHKNIKIPAVNEPQIHPKTDYVVIVCGLSCLGKTIKNHHFRYELGLDGKIFFPHEKITQENILHIL